MSDTVIKVESLGKLYRLGEIGTGTLSHDLNRWWAKVRGKEDPFAKVGERNDRTVKGSSDYVWSLKDINFEVQQGEVLGIIGRNGAGKSTLLKILSKVTAPTEGSVKVKGRIASLLEVGTGFHPELTGRENVYLNGAILGMSKDEINKKFDEIVDFSGVERYIDTPVKRYSSGMYVRLAFAVAAFLEPEILIVDEVLAVGDAEFQKKCLGRMKDVSKNEGRTILFVSHDLNAISTLTQNCILMVNGQLEMKAPTDAVVQTYLNKNIESKVVLEGDRSAPSIAGVELKTTHNGFQNFGSPLTLELDVVLPYETDSLEFSFQICKSDTSEPVIYNWFSTAKELEYLKRKRGKFRIRVEIDSFRLYKGEYFFKFNLSDPRGKVLHQHIERILTFEVLMQGVLNEWGLPDNICKYIEDCKVSFVEIPLTPN